VEKRRLHNEGLHDSNFFPNVIRVIKSRIIRWPGACSTYGGEERCIQGVYGET
jgi:hypothetical protein